MRVHWGELQGTKTEGELADPGPPGGEEGPKQARMLTAAGVNE